ncbi:uncharacterized protein [Drosophila kikkawai]|uniref:Uncharacterized protein n=1 Tax=Drosophila kikkawai TaxID=30033 RepID=A0A6P4I8W4_DROKI|nr:uncharacterized protein LOC108076312 [Drosophila kikkawai]
MIYLIFHFIIIFLTIAAAASNSKAGNYHTPVKGIVNDLIENWEPPFAYLKSRGYLAEDLPSAPELQDFQQQLQENSDQELPLEKDSKRNLGKKKKCDSRNVRLSDEPKDMNLKDMFRDLFSSKKSSVSEDLKAKLNVDWDMNALKYSAQESAKKYVKGYKAPVEQADQDEETILKKPRAQVNLLKKPSAQDLHFKEPQAQELLLQPSLPFDNPSDWPNVWKSPLMRRKKMVSKQENQGKYF